MKKLTIGIKIDKKVVYLKTQNIHDFFDVSRITRVLEILLKHNTEKE